jgi:hypothetical protein
LTFDNNDDIDPVASIKNIVREQIFSAGPRFL